jgi:hypothetical protein
MDNLFDATRELNTVAVCSFGIDGDGLNISASVSDGLGIGDFVSRAWVPLCIAEFLI